MEPSFVFDYSWIFSSIVIYCSIILIYYIFVVNDKSQKITQQNTKALKSKKGKEIDLINSQFDLNRRELIQETSRLVRWMLLVEIIVNILLLVFKYDFKIRGVIGSILIPIVAYLILILVLKVAVGMKGQKVLFVRGLIHGK